MDAERSPIDPAAPEPLGHGWPPPPPWDGHSWAPPPPPPPPPPPRRGAQPLAIALVILALASGGVGAGLGVALHSGSLDQGGSAGALPNQLPFDSVRPPTGSGPSGSSPTLDVATIASQVDPAVADITATLARHTGVAAGTGMVISSTGLVLTNNHVIEGTSSIRVQLSGTGPSYSARVLGVDPTDDVALLQLQLPNTSKLPTVSLGDSTHLSVGDPVVAIGNAFGLSGPPSVSEGAVTGLNRTITAGDLTGSAETLHGLIQINAAIRPGDSGGPLLDHSGRVIGMNTAASVGAGRRGNVAFAIPIKTAVSIAQQIQSGKLGGNIEAGQAGYLGVEVEAASSGPGARVTGVTPNSPAAAAGIAPRDVIVSLAGQTVESGDTLGPAIRSHRPGDRVTVTWLDPIGERHTAAVQLAAGPPA